MAGEASSSLHIVVFPWLAFGHMLPYLELSKSLAKRGHHISFISTPRNIRRLSPETAHLIDFIPLEVPQTEGLREGAEATTDILPDEVPYLKKALDRLEEPFARFIKEASPKPDWIIHDMFQHWIPQIAAEVSVPRIYFNTFSALCFVFYGTKKVAEKHGLRTTPEEYTVPPPWIPFPSKLAYHLHEVRQIFKEFVKTKSTAGVSDASRVSAVLQGCTAMAIRSSMEVESKWLTLVPEIFDIPVIPVGLLVPRVPDDRDGDEVILEWLSEQRSKSVVYVAFGSEVMLSIELIHELAHGLELAKLPFLWALRRRVGMADSIDMLPEGFEERSRGYGLVCKGWVPQLKILGHESVGGFLTHGGWSSVTEGLRFGQPLALLPVFGDQGLNARVMEENGVGVEVERDEEDGSFTRESVAKVLKLVMSEDGGPYRKNAEELRDALAKEECQEKYVDAFVQYLQSNRNNSKT